MQPKRPLKRLSDHWQADEYTPVKQKRLVFRVPRYPSGEQRATAVAAAESAGG